MGRAKQGRAGTDSSTVSMACCAAVSSPTSCSLRCECVRVRSETLVSPISRRALDARCAMRANLLYLYSQREHAKKEERQRAQKRASGDSEGLGLEVCRCTCECVCRRTGACETWRSCARACADDGVAFRNERIKRNHQMPILYCRLNIM